MTHTSNNRRTGFTLIEILVVIAIIAVLAGILLAALSGVQKAAQKTKTETLMQSFGRACDEFALDHGRYPGILPDASINGTSITSTQNALLELMGGARVRSNQSTSTVISEFDAFIAGGGTTTFNIGSGWQLAFNPTKFGEGPWISGRLRDPYFSPKASDLEYSAYDDAAPENFRFPSLVDAWNTPIIYLRSVRKSGPIIALGSNNPLPQYDLPGLGQFVDDPLNANSSLLSESQTDESRLAWLTLLLAHPTFWEIDDTNAGSEFTAGAAWGTTRGRYMLLSAGPDNVFLEVANEQVHTNQEINFGTPFDSLINPSEGIITPSVMESFDDVVIHGGA